MNKIDELKECKNSLLKYFFACEAQKFKKILIF